MGAAFSWPLLKIIPASFVSMASRPDKGFVFMNVPAAYALLVVYLWVSYYLVWFVPYRILYREFQTHDRRRDQVQLSLTHNMKNDLGHHVEDVD